MEFDLAIVLSAAGAVASAALIASVIELAKRIAIVGPWIDAKREPSVAIILSAALVAYAAWATDYVSDPISGFAAFLAFLGIAKLASATHDTASDVKAAFGG